MKVFTLIFILLLSLVQSQNNCDKNKAQNGNKMPETNVNSNKNADSDKFDELPDGVKLTDEVRDEVTGEDGKKTLVIITVEEKLKQLGARYIEGKLSDSKGKEIKFYRPPVRGASQGFEEDQKQQKRDAEELKKLKEKYTVITLYVNPLKVM